MGLFSRKNENPRMLNAYAKQDEEGRIAQANLKPMNGKETHIAESSDAKQGVNWARRAWLNGAGHN
jgi:hypothetical protein